EVSAIAATRTESASSAVPKTTAGVRGRFAGALTATSCLTVSAGVLFCTTNTTPVTRQLVLRRRCVLLASCVGLSISVAGGAQAGSPKLGPNLAPNPSFEQSSADPATQQGIPVTPVGW